MKKNIKLIPLFLFLFVFQLLYFLSTIYTEKNLIISLLIPGKSVYDPDLVFFYTAVLSDVLKKSNTEMELAFLQKAETIKTGTGLQSSDPQTGYSGFSDQKLYRNFRISRYFWNRENMNRLILRSEI
mgnify:CR=1 FL=1